MRNSSCSLRESVPGRDHIRVQTDVPARVWRYTCRVPNSACLEIELRHNLTHPGARSRTARDAEVEQISDIRSRRSAANPKIGAIEDIEELPTNLEVDRLSNPSALDEPYVVIVGIRVSQGADVGRRIAEFKRSGDGEEVVVQPWG
jgi:hypothetical protein